MFNLKKELRKRLYFEYRFSPKSNSDSINFLTEIHGVPNIVDEISLVFKEIVEKHINYLISSGQKTCMLSPTSNSFPNLSSYFFENINISIRLSLSDKNRFQFGYLAKDDNFDGQKLIDCDINGSAELRIDSLKSDISSCVALFAHELTHAYEDWNRYVNNKETLSQNVEKYGYTKNTAKDETIGNLSKKRLSIIIYYLTPTEIRAYCSQIIKKNESELSKCSTSKQAFNVISKDVIFQNYQTIEKWVDDICKGRIFCNKEDIVIWWKEITGKNYSYNRICNYLSDKMNKAKRHIINNITKKINDIALTNGKWTFLTNNNMPLDGETSE